MSVFQFASVGEWLGVCECILSVFFMCFFFFLRVWIWVFFLLLTFTANYETSGGVELNLSRLTIIMKRKKGGNEVGDLSIFL